MSLPSLIFVYNRRLGKRKRSRLIRQLKSRKRNFAFTWEIWETEYAGHARILAKEAAGAGAAAIVAVGGDGTVNEVIQGMVGRGSTLGILPLGSGNGLARSLGIPLRLGSALDVLNQQVSRKIDLGLANGHPFASNAGLGFDAQVIEGFHRLPTRGLGSYLLAILSRFWTYKPQPCRLRFSDGSQRELAPFLLALANSQAWGYGFWLDRSRSMEDGLLDLYLLHPFPWWAGPRLAWLSLTGRLNQSPYVESLALKELTVHQKGLTFFQADGDLYTATESVRFKVKAGALRVFAPARDPQPPRS